MTSVGSESESSRGYGSFETILGGDVTSPSVRYNEGPTDLGGSCGIPFNEKGLHPGLHDAFIFHESIFDVINSMMYL